MLLKAVTPSPTQKKHVMTSRSSAKKRMQNIRAHDLARYKASMKAKAMYKDSDLKAVLVDILEDPKHNVSVAVRERNIGYKDNDPRKIPFGTVYDWWKKVKPHLSKKKDWLGTVH